ncbi:MAG: CvpA family protein [Lachnospiraceae bacterium]|nr:CvpA family protein [Lachnospiraceae bacterium]
MLELGLLAAAVAVPVLFAIRGYRRGIVRSILSLVSIILTFFLVGVLQPYVSDAIEKYTPLETMVRESVEDVMKTRILNELALPGDPLGESGVFQGMEITGEQQTDWMNICEIPEGFQEGIGVTAKEAAEDFIERVSTYITEGIMRILVFLITFAIVYLVIRFAALAVMAIAHLPGIRTVNQMLGGVFGLCEGFLVLWLITLFVTLLLPSDLGQIVISGINSNPLLAALYRFMLIPFGI